MEGTRNPEENLTSEEESEEETLIFPRVPAEKPNNCRIQDIKAFFTIVEKLARLLKSGNEGRLTSIFEKILTLVEGKEADETDAVYEITDTFLENLEDCCVDYLRYFKAHLIDVAMPRELRSLYVDKNKITDHCVLGTGGFSEVIRGQLKKPRAPFVTVAIKKAAHESFNRMFLEEASLMRRFDHEVILKLLAVNRDGGVVRLVLELMESGDLVGAIIKEGLRLSTSDVLKITHDVASGMEYLSDKQYVHRDLKCANVFINLKKECKIGDFGLCKYVGDSDGVYMDTKMRLNNAHVAPETKDTKRFTTKSDVWAMGVLIFELFALRKMCFRTQDASECLLLVEYMWKMFFSSGHLLQIDGCPTELHNYLVKKILNKNPTNRPSFGIIKRKIIDIIKEHKPNYFYF